MKDDFGELQQLVFLDRYAVKDVDSDNLAPGDKVVVSVKDHPVFPEKAVGEIVERSDMDVRVRLVSGEEVCVSVSEVDKPLELSPEQMWERVVEDIVCAEDEKVRPLVKKSFEWLLDNFRFVPGGRTMAAAGVSNKKTMLNCFVIAPPHDSRGGILQSAIDMIEIMSRGGGVGILISSLRPRSSRVFGVNGRSSGSVAWGELYSIVTMLVNQDGGRRGALMMMQNDWHPDLMEFIRDKTTPGRKEGCNMSVLVSDRFMQALKNREDWTFVYPDYETVGTGVYDHEWDGDLEKWVRKGYPVKEYGKMPASEIWSRLIESVWVAGEPGVIFIERVNKLSNSWYYDKLIGSNPCGEQLLPVNGVCNLGHLVLPRFVQGGGMNWDELRRGVRFGVRFLDDVLDRTNYVLEKIRKQALKERRIGLGTMGLGELLLALSLKYGSDESLDFVDGLYKFIAVEAYRESVRLAIEKGPFPAFDREKYIDSEFVRRLPWDVKEAIYEHGIRNVSLLSQAPTGSGGTMVGTSTGIEPWYAWEYTRNGRFGSFKEEVRSVREWRKSHRDQELPEYFVTALDLSPEDHIRMQAAIQVWTDAGISKTVNCPGDASLEDVKKVYELAYDLGCKGVTLYRDRSREEQVLVTEESRDISCRLIKTANGIERSCSLM